MYISLKENKPYLKEINVIRAVNIIPTAKPIITPFSLYVLPNRKLSINAEHVSKTVVIGIRI